MGVDITEFRVYYEALWQIDGSRPTTMLVADVGAWWASWQLVVG